jgi:hypothetical protein
VAGGEGANQDIGERSLGQKASAFALNEKVPGFVRPESILPGPLRTRLYSDSSEKLVLQTGIAVKGGG